MVRKVATLTARFRRGRDVRALNGAVSEHGATHSPCVLKPACISPSLLFRTCRCTTPLPRPMSPLLTCVVDHVGVVGVGADQGHEVGSSKVVFGDGEKGRAPLGVVAPKEALQITQAAWGKWRRRERSECKKRPKQEFGGGRQAAARPGGGTRRRAVDGWHCLPGALLSTGSPTQSSLLT